MRHEEGRFAGVGGLQLYWQAWLPDAAPHDAAPQAVLALVHGVGEHSGRYLNLVGPLVEGGHPVYSYDQRGHGRSPGPRVHIERWTDYRDDLRAFLGLVAQHAPHRPLVLYGHSMGSLVVLDYLLQRPDGLAGAIVSGVALQPAGVGKPYQAVIARVLSRVTPRLSVDLGIHADSLTRDAESLEAAKTDPYLTSRATVRWGAQGESRLPWTFEPQVIAREGDLCVVRAVTRYPEGTDGEPGAVAFHNLWLVTLAADGRAREFVEYFMLAEFG